MERLHDLPKNFPGDGDTKLLETIPSQAVQVVHVEASFKRYSTEDTRSLRLRPFPFRTGFLVVRLDGIEAG